MFSSHLHRNFPRRFGALIISGALVASFAGLAWTTPATATTTPPTADGKDYDGNKNCADMAPAGVTWEEFKIDGGNPDDGDHPIPNSDLVITISNTSSQTFDWASNFDMSAVLVKGSNGGIHYQYPGPNDKSDTGLHAPALHALVDDVTNLYHDISHVSFCYKVGGDTQPSVDETVTPPVAPEPANPEPANPQPVAPQLVTSPTPASVVEPGTEVLGETLVRGDTLPRTGMAATQPLALAGGLGLILGLAMLMLASRRTALESS